MRSWLAPARYATFAALSEAHRPLPIRWHLPAPYGRQCQPESNCIRGNHGGEAAAYAPRAPAFRTGRDRFACRRMGGRLALKISIKLRRPTAEFGSPAHKFQKAAR